MKTTLSTSEAANILISDTCANWSRAGAFALVEYLEEIEDSTGEEIEFDRVAIRCDFSEYDSPQEAAEDYGWKPDSHIEEDGSECDADALQWLESRTSVIEFDGGVIIQNF